MIIGATEVTVRSGPGTPQYSNSLINRCWCIAVESQPAVLAWPIQSEPAPFADLAAKCRQLATLELEVMLGHLGTQRGGDVVAEELPHLGQPRPLLIVELELHNRDLSPLALFPYLSLRKADNVLSRTARGRGGGRIAL